MKMKTIYKKSRLYSIDKHIPRGILMEPCLVIIYEILTSHDFKHFENHRGTNSSIFAGLNHCKKQSKVLINIAFVQKSLKPSHIISGFE